MKITSELLQFFDAYDTVHETVIKKGMLYYASEILEDNEELLQEEYARWQHHIQGELR